MLLADFLKQGTAALESLYPAEEAHGIVLMLCEEIIGTKSYTHIVEPQYQIDKKWEQPLARAMERLGAGEPIQYVIGRTDFCGHSFKVNRNVLMVGGGNSAAQEALYLKNSGCIAWSVALAVPGARVVGVDISDKALEVARSQDFSEELKETGAVAPTFVKADVLESGESFQYDHGQFDLILSNPPYVMEKEKPAMRRNVLDYEPALALFVPDSDPLLFYRAVARWSQRFLAPEGKGLTEINEALGNETVEVFRSSGFHQSETVTDFFDKNRFVFYMR